MIGGIYINKKWTKEKIQILKEKYSICNCDELAILLYPFNKQDIYQKAHKLQLKKDNNYFWTEEDVLYLKSNYKKVTYQEMSNVLHKSIGAINQKAYKIGLLKPIEGKWSEEDIAYLKNNYSYIDNKILAQYFNREIHSIIDKAVSLNLKKKIFKKKYNDNELNDFLNNVKLYADKLNRTPLVNEIFNQSWSMQNASLNRYFGGYRNVCRLLGLDININVFGSVKPIYESKNKDLCWSKAEVIITNYFIDNNINYKKEVYYKDYSNDKRFNNKSADWIINNNTFIEYFGMMDKEHYAIKANNKINLCNDNNLYLIPIYPKDLTNLNIIFEDFISN